MDIGSIKKLIQDFFQEGTLTIVGSGLSMSEGVPGMEALAANLLELMLTHLTSESDKNNWYAIAKQLESGIGLENALYIVPPTDCVETIIRKVTSNFIRSHEQEAIKKLLSGSQPLRFSEYINRFVLRNSGLNVITTNYDRLIEFACEHMGIRVNTLFVGRYVAKLDPDESKYTLCRGLRGKGNSKRLEYAPCVTVLKPHGCLSWYSVKGEPRCIPSEMSGDCLIITPGMNKYQKGYNIPFDIHREHANRVIDSSSKYIFIGYGFGDAHLETHLSQQLRYGKPALIFTRSLTDNAKKVIGHNSNIIAIVQEGSDGSKIINSQEELSVPQINLWDISDMIKEVF